MVNNKQKKQQGFTLVEIIAVLVILGIMAAVAVPRFFDMQASAEQQTLRTAHNDMISRANMAYANSLLANSGAALVADMDSWQDLGLSDQATLDTTYTNFAGTWTHSSETQITYVDTSGTTYTFTVTPVNATVPPNVVAAPPFNN
jgi:prepilin-type N-terminal cleavage/methylation domain-containing protein